MSRARTKKEGSALATVLIKRLQFFLLQEDKQARETLQCQQTVVREYFTALGLHLHLDEQDGYAFLRTTPMDENENGMVSQKCLNKPPCCYPRIAPQSKWR